ncbi:leucine efflux protein LeuE, partial [Klebsiella pneumoniae]
VILVHVSLFVHFLTANANLPVAPFFFIALDPALISFYYMRFCLQSGSFVSPYVKSAMNLAKLANSLIFLVFVAFAAPLATLQS